MDDVIKRKRRPSLRSISQNARTFLIVGPLKELAGSQAPTRHRDSRENKIIWIIIMHVNTRSRVLQERNSFHLN